MIYITEIPHRGLPRSWEAEDEDAFVLKLCAANPRSGELYSDMSFDDAVVWLRANLRDLRIYCIDPDQIFESIDEARKGAVFARPIATCRATYPEGLTGESAYYACDGPDIQRIEELQRIINLCDHWETPEAQALADEARSYLPEYG